MVVPGNRNNHSLKKIMKRYDVASAEDLIFIPCHLNTSKKIERVKKLIEHYSTNHFVLIGSHHEIPEDVISLADFSFVDKNNPIVGVHDNCHLGRIYVWAQLGDKILSKTIPYHGYAHMLLLKNAYYLSLGWNFKRFHHINYDMSLSFCDNNKIKDFEKILENKDAIFYKWYNNEDRYDTNLFSFNLKKNVDAFTNMKTFTEWDNQNFGFSTEQFLYNSFLDFDKCVFDAEERIDDEDSVNTIPRKRISYLHPYCSDLIGPIILYKDENKYQLYMASNSKKPENVKITLDDEIIHNFMVNPSTTEIRPICNNFEKNRIVRFYVNNELKNTFDVSKDFNIGELS